MTKIDELGKLLYDEYCAAVGGKSFNGDDLPPFERTPDRIQRAWKVAATAAARHLELDMHRELLRRLDEERRGIEEALTLVHNVDPQSYAE